MEYIEKTLGLSVTHQPWAGADKLPYFISERYRIELAGIGQTPVLFLHPQMGLDSVGTIQKHIARIQKEGKLPVVLILPTINRYRRDTLIEAHIPFVVPEKQLYLPFIGAVLQERFGAETYATEQLQPSAQVLFFYYLYQKTKELYISNAVTDLGYSAMTISRAARQLIQTGLFTERKDGVQKILSSQLTRIELFQQMKPLLISPVHSKGYVAVDHISDEYCIAGISALAQATMLNAPNTACYAVHHKQHRIECTECIDDRKYAAVELWKYDPRLLSREGMVDPLSLILSLDTADERMEMETEDLLIRTLED